VAKRRDDFARGRFVARALIGDVRAVDPVRISLIPDDDGVPWPEVEGGGRLPVSASISHTSGVAAAALVELPFRVGVDVEHPIVQSDQLAQEYFEPSEIAWCQAAEAPWRTAEIWALKEAGLKSLGTGLRLPASAIQVSRVHSAPTETGWRNVELNLGPSAPDRHREMRGWVRREGAVAVAMSILVPPGAGPAPAPAVPLRIGA